MFTIILIAASSTYSRAAAFNDNVMKPINAKCYRRYYEIAPRLISSTFICLLFSGSSLRLLSVLRLVSAFHLPTTSIFGV